MSTSLESPALRVAANQMLVSLRDDVAKVSMFTTNFTADAAQKGSTLLIPIASDGAAEEFNEETNNYGKINGTVRYVPMKFNHHPKHSFGFKENDFNLVNGTYFWEKTGEVSAARIGRAIAEAVGGLINKENIPNDPEEVDTTEFMDEHGDTISTGTGEHFSAANETVLSGTLDKKKIAGLRAACRAVKIPVRDTILALNSVTFAELLSLLDANMYGGTEAIRSGLIPDLYGYKAVMEVDELNDQNLIGALIPATSIAIASRTLDEDNPKLYAEMGTVTDDDSGLILQMRRGGNWETGRNVGTVEALFGARLIQPTKIVRIVSAATGS